MITKDMTLADVVKAYPNTIGFLNGLHLDYRWQLMPHRRRCREKEGLWT